jgi:transposase-like protein
MRQPEEIVEILEQYRQSGLSQIKFSKDHGIGPSTLQYWLRKQRDGRLPTTLDRDSPPLAKQLVPVKIVDSPAASVDSFIEFELTKGAKLRFSCDVPPEVVARYAEALGHRC